MAALAQQTPSLSTLAATTLPHGDDGLDVAPTATAVNGVGAAAMDGSPPADHMPQDGDKVPRPPCPSLH